MFNFFKSFEIKIAAIIFIINWIIQVDEARMPIMSVVPVFTLGIKRWITIEIRKVTEYPIKIRMAYLLIKVLKWLFVIAADFIVD